jgi:hypothetical protein
MAGEREMDAATGLMHQCALTLYRDLLSRAPDPDADIQAALISGLIAALAELLWNGRADNSTPESLAAVIEASALDLLQQMKARQMRAAH